MKWLCILGLVAGFVANAAPLQFQSSERQVALLELYTSEGCSSCPPAEAWLSRLKTASGLWSEFVPVAFHVDYWNRLGWRDNLSREQFSNRQREYAQAWSAENIYTPEFVLNGREWRDWVGFRGAPSASASKVGVLQVSSADGRHWQANFTPAENGASNYEVTAALLVSEVSSDVKAGENAGRHLNHDFAALSLITRPLTTRTNGLQGSFILDATAKGITGRPALAVWVTRSGHPEPLQATGGWLTPGGDGTVCADLQKLQAGDDAASGVGRFNLILPPPAKQRPNVAELDALQAAVGAVKRP